MRIKLICQTTPHMEKGEILHRRECWIREVRHLLGDMFDPRILKNCIVQTVKREGFPFEEDDCYCPERGVARTDG